MTALPIMPAFEENNVAVTLQSSDFNAPYAAVTIQSIIDNASENNNYDIIITTLDMVEKNAEAVCAMAESYKNISIRVVNILDLYDRYEINQIVDKSKRFDEIAVCRIFYHELFEKYEKIVSIKENVLLCKDIAELFYTDLGNNYIAAAPDLYALYAYYNDACDGYFKKAINGFIALPNPEQYIDGGCIVFNFNAIRSKFAVKQIVGFIKDNNCQYYEQDVFSFFFKDNIYRLGLKWNCMIYSNRAIEEGVKKTQCHLYDEYIAARKNPNIMCYIGEKKPWLYTNSSFSTKWWNIAFRTPLYEQISEQRYNTKEIKPTRLLFMCDTVMQLINILNIKVNLYSKTKADIIFTKATDFSEYFEPVEKLGLFEQIYRSDYNTSVDFQKLKQNAPNTSIMKNPAGYERAVQLTEKYSDYFIATASSLAKITYYQLVNSGCTPRIHFYEEGSTTYTFNIHNNIMHDSIFNHNVYKEKERFDNNVYEILLYEPQLYSAGEKYALSVLPKIAANNSVLVNALYSVFGRCSLPKEKYIFFSECFAVDNCVSDDIEILDRIAERVGKDNITVKAHPRGEMEEKFYKMHGYNIFAEKTIPWEIFVLSAEIENKILISVSSNTLLNQSIIFGKDVPAVFLLNSMILSKRPAICYPAYKSFFNKAISFMNSKEKIVFCPNNIKELDAVIEYLEGNYNG